MGSMCSAEQQKIAEKAEEVVEQAKEVLQDVQEKAGEVAEQAKEIAEDVKEKVEQAAEQVKEVAADAAEAVGVTEVVADVKEAAKDMAEATADTMTAAVAAATGAVIVEFDCGKGATKTVNFDGKEALGFTCAKGGSGLACCTSAPKPKVVVGKVEKGQQADKHGVKRGWAVVSISGTRVNGPVEANKLLQDSIPKPPTA